MSLREIPGSAPIAPRTPQDGSRDFVLPLDAYQEDLSVRGSSEEEARPKPHRPRQPAAQNEIYLRRIGLRLFDD